MLAAVGISSPPEALCQQAGQALGAAEQFGYPIVLKACSPDLTHKSDLGLRLPPSERGVI